MRISDRFEKGGYFWLPSTPEKRVPGVLYISDGGTIKLEIIGLLDESLKALNGQDNLERIIGLIEDDGYVTLDKCFYTTKRISFGNFGVSKSIIHVNQAFTGVAYSDEEKVTFKSLRFSVEGLDDWLGMSGISAKYSQDLKTVEINYEPQNTISFNLSENLRLEIIFGYSLPTVNKYTNEAKITQHAYLQLVSKEEKSLSYFVSYVFKITNFLSFAIDETVTITEVSASSDTLTKERCNGKKIPVPIKIYYPSLPFSQESPKISYHNMLFTFEQSKQNFEKIINIWVDNYGLLGPSLHLYFSVRSGVHRYLDSKFLALAQALETYHRRTSDVTLMENSKFIKIVDEILSATPSEHRKWLEGRLIHGNEINLGKRIKLVIEPFKEHLGNSKERSKFIRNIVDTRNYLTHYSKTLESAYQKVDLWPLCQKMEVVFQLHLLMVTGFTKTEISNFLSRNNNLQQKLKKI